MRRALVVAHPDDEALWFGGLLIAEPGDWTVICCSIPLTDPVRAWKFFDACEVLKAKPRLLPFVEPGASADLQHLEHLDLSGFDQVVTHSASGEYGHRHHFQLHRLLKGAVNGCYGTTPGAKVIRLTDEQYDQKMSAIRCYDHVSPSDGLPKWQALIGRYGKQFDLKTETYVR
jgi:hypothetical protein